MVKNDERSVKMPDAALCVNVTRLVIQWDKRPSLCEAVGWSPYNAVVLGCFVARKGRMGSCGPRLRLSMGIVVEVNEVRVLQRKVKKAESQLGVSTFGTTVSPFGLYK
jgi:hypothetical protein